jgi:HlyD family secretion protein
MNEANTNQGAAQKSMAKMLKLDQATGLFQNPRRWLISAAVVFALVLVVIWWGSGDDDAVRYTTHTVQRGNLTVTVTATGTLQPTNQVDVGSELSGIIKTVNADYNQRVKVGQVLARLDTTKLEAQRLQSQAALESAQAKVLQAQATEQEARLQLTRFEEVRELSGGKVPSQQDFGAAEATLKRAQADEASAKAQVAQAQATLNATRTDLAKAVIRSPINGVVLARSVEPGQTVAASFQAPVLFTLAEDLSRMELHVDVDEADVGHVKEGQNATFTVDAYPDRPFPARTTQVRFGAKTSEGVVTYEALLTVDNTELALRPGMTATAAIIVDRIENALLVPATALRFAPPQAEAPAEGASGLAGRLLPRPPSSPPKSREDEDKKSKRVWILRDSQPTPIAVTTGATNGIMTVVTGGDLAEGTAVITDAVTVK